MPKKAIITLAALLFLFSFLLSNLKSSAEATSLTNLSDTLTRLQKGELSSHNIQFNLPVSESFDAGETIHYYLGENDALWKVNRTTSSISDFDFNDGVDRNIVGNDGDCIGHLGFGDVVLEIEDSAKLLLVFPCENFVSSTPGARIIFKIGSFADGKDIIRNPAKSGSAIIKITHTNQSFETNFGQLAVPIMEFDGVGIYPSEIISNPNILGSQIDKIKKEESSQDSLYINQTSKETSTSSQANLVVEDCFFANFTSTIPKF